MGAAGALDAAEMTLFWGAVGASDGLRMTLPYAAETALFEDAAGASGGKVLLNAGASTDGEEVMHLDSGSVQGEYPV
jgi:hypothetical protein